MDIGLLIGLCIFFYAIAALITYVRIEDEKILQRINQVYRFFEGLLYSLTTLLLFIGIQIWLQNQ